MKLPNRFSTVPVIGMLRRLFVLQLRAIAGQLLVILGVNYVLHIALPMLAIVVLSCLLNLGSHAACWRGVFHHPAGAGRAGIGIVSGQRPLNGWAAACACCRVTVAVAVHGWLSACRCKTKRNVSDASKTTQLAAG